MANLTVSYNFIFLKLAVSTKIKLLLETAQLSIDFILEVICSSFKLFIFTISGVPFRNNKVLSLVKLIGIQFVYLLKAHYLNKFSNYISHY
jgi:hypothetical protein